MPHRRVQLVASVVAVAALVGCAPAAPAPPVEPDATWQVVETQNGSASFRIPAAWSIDDRSSMRPDASGAALNDAPGWVNEILVLDEHGAQRLRYEDTPFSSASTWAPSDDPVVVEEVPAGQGLAVESWVDASTTCVLLCSTSYVARMQVLQGGSQQILVGDATDRRVHVFGSSLQDLEEQAFGSEQDARAHLTASDARIAQAVLSTIEVEAVGGSAVPPGIAAPTTFAWTTPNGSASMDIPISWYASEWADDVGDAHYTHATFNSDPPAISVAYDEWDGSQEPLVAIPPAEFAVVASVDTRDGYAATAWWQTTSYGAVHATVALTAPLEEGVPPYPRIDLETGEAIDLYAGGDPSGYGSTGLQMRSFPSIEAAEAFLRGEEATQMLAAFGTYDLHDELGAPLPPIP